MLKYAVIGTSWITKSWIAATEAAGGFRFEAVYSRTEARGKAFAAEFGVSKIYTSLADLAADPAVDAVYIASPNACHFEQAEQMLGAGKHVICEKPIARNEERVLRLTALAQERGVVFMEAIKSIYAPGAEAVRKALPRLGKISQASFVFQQRSSRYDALMRGEMPNIFRPELEAGAVMDIGVYCLYPALYFFGMYDSLMASAVLLENGADLFGDAILNYPEMRVTLSYSKAANQAVPSQIIGDRGAIVIDKISTLSGISLHLNDGTHEVLAPPAKEPDMQYEAEFFRNAAEAVSGYREIMIERNQLSAQVCRGLEEIRRLVGIAF